MLSDMQKKIYTSTGNTLLKLTGFIVTKGKSRSQSVKVSNGICFGA